MKKIILFLSFTLIISLYPMSPKDNVTIEMPNKNNNNKQKNKHSQKNKPCYCCARCWLSCCCWLCCCDIDDADLDVFDKN